MALNYLMAADADPIFKDFIGGSINFRPGILAEDVTIWNMEGNPSKSGFDGISLIISRSVSPFGQKIPVIELALQGYGPECAR